VDLIQENPDLVVALGLGFLCLSSLMGGLLRPILTFLLVRRLLIFALPFSAGAGGILYLLN
jgi:hypothetical protein